MNIFMIIDITVTSQFITEIQLIFRKQNKEALFRSQELSKKTKNIVKKEVLRMKLVYFQMKSLLIFTQIQRKNIKIPGFFNQISCFELYFIMLASVEARPIIIQLMDKIEDPSPQYPHSENADLQYILDLFNSEELNLTIAEDTEENQRSSRISNKRSEDSIDVREEVSDAKYRFAFLSFFRKYRQAAVTFIDAAIRFMNGIKKLKMEDLVKQLSEEEVMPAIMDSLVCPELLIEPIEDELAYRQLSENDMVRYGEALSILKGSKNLTAQEKSRIRTLLSQIEAH